MVAGEGQPSGRIETPVDVSTWALPRVSEYDAIDRLGSLGSVWSGPDETTVITGGITERLTATGPARFQHVRDEANALFDRLSPEDLPDPARPRLFGGFSFFDANYLNTPWEAFPPAMFVLPRWQVAITEENTWVTVTDAGEPDTRSTEAELHRIRTALEDGSGTPEIPPGILRSTPRVDAETWKEHVGEIVSAIDDGALEKAVLAYALEVELRDAFTLGSVYEELSETYPGCFRFAFSPHESGIESGDAVFFGASPERLVSKSGQSVNSDALAGTVPRSEDGVSSTELSKRLRSDPKMQAEHAVVVEHIRDRLSTVSSDVRVSDRRVRRLETVQHLQSGIEATVDEATHVLELVDRLHPTPAVGGVPPEAAMATIERLESLDRGWYAAPVGWFDANGDGTFAVGIRSALANDRTATVFAGNGIVADSDPDDEFDEVQLKFSPVLDHLKRGSSETEQ
ncbi:MAG: isochorismate synthase MenF [Halodesulfurarchaeum sp.]